VFSKLLSSTALVATIAVAACGGTPPPAPEATPPPAPKSEAITRADALIADMKKRQAALEQSDRAAPGKAAKVPVAAVVQPNPASEPSQMPRGVDLVSSNYTVAERGQAFWRLSWRTSVRNQQRAPIRARVEMDFRDAKGALISAGEQTLNINAGAVVEVTGFVSVKATDGPRVASATPKITLLN
jgi:hypothetical protein